ncbi:hypothetical protein GE061_012662 [Apolygus lucorum]|uniref:Uncharacterized protein n=1 Tax=Apolygus lucorum TaxID=248454 RepID=A0A6A4K2F8_APOLU|nr:hypothetical protein GE061_012662 [Apolygus lucorum]
MDASPVKRLYKYYGLLAEAAEQGDKILQHEDLFNNIISARHGNSEEKRLAAQFIPKFCTHFPHLLNSAVSAQLDLCEDSDLVVRKQAVKEVTALCRANPQCTKRVAYFIAQLLGAEDVGEGLLVRNTLVALFTIDPSATLGGMFAQIRDGTPKMQERCKTFLSNRFGNLNKSVIAKMRETLANELEICLENSNSQEIPTIIPLIPYAVSGESDVDKSTVEILEQQLSLEKDLLTADEEDMKRIYVFTKFAKPHFNKGINSGGFVSFYALSVLPLIKDIEGYNTGTGQAAAMLKQLAEIVTFCSDLPDPENCFINVFQALQDLLPQNQEVAEENEEKKRIQIHFTLIESLLATLLEMLSRVTPSYDSYESSLEELRTNLKHLISYVEPYRKRIAELDKATMDRNLKSICLRCVDNIKILCRQFFSTPPKSVNVVHSWYQTEVVAKKRRTSSTSLPPVEQHKKVDHHKARGIQQIYTPPGGKYSRSFKRF